MPESLLKVLCFHGYRQSGESFKQKTGSLRKVLKKYAELQYITAPHTVPPLQEVENEDVEQGRGWWFSREDNYFSAKHKSDFVKGFEDSVKLVEDFVASNGPFDGILGFSQGAAFVALLCQLKEAGSLRFSFKFAIMVAGFISQASPHRSLYSQCISLPTLHVYGKSDQVIGEQMSIDLLEHFKDPHTLEHPGGHFVPASSQQKIIYIQFIEKMQKLCNS